MTTKVATQRLKHGTDVPELRDVLEQFAATSGFKFYTYITGRVVGGRRITNFDPRERPFHLTNIPSDFQAEYSKQQYYDQDPTMLFALGNLMPESWSNIIRRSKMTAKQHQIIADARDSGLGDGVIIPIHGPGGEFAVLSLTHSESAKQAQSNVDLDDDALHMFALRFHNAVRSRQDAGTAELPASLTSREIDVLFWTAEGKSSWDISQILDISESTVNFHINSAKQKLGVYSKPHAVAKMFSFDDRELF
jgi:DNA-binding CsgD family transcriptional regulator